MRAISTLYQCIYADETRTSSIAVGHMPGMMNRNETNGKYGIWGHELGDLVISGVLHNPDRDVYILLLSS